MSPTMVTGFRVPSSKVIEIGFSNDVVFENKLESKVMLPLALVSMI